MKHKSFEIAVISVSEQRFDLKRASELTGIHPDLIAEFERGKLVERFARDQNGQPVFDAAGICRLRLLSDLREREKLSLRMMRVFCHLMDELERAESEVRHLRHQRR